MLFRRLVESNSRGSLVATIEGYAVSLIAHVAILGGTAVASHQAIPSGLAESFTPVAYFMPRDRIVGSRPKQERITYVSTEATAGGGDAVPDAKPLVPSKPAAEPGPGLSEMSSELSEAEAPSEESRGDSIMSVLEVDSAAARYDDSAAPPYPPEMLEKKIEGSVGIQYVVDTTGHADPGSIIVLSSTHEDFAQSVRVTLPLMQFRPAIMNGRKVRQLVQQLFAFRIDTTLVAQQPGKKPDKPEQR
jgi:TonB family protein